MNISVHNTTGFKIPNNFLSQILRIAAGTIKIPRRKSVSMAFVSDAIMKKLNSRYRKIQTATDVLSFSERERASNIPNFENTLGEIIISYPRAREQAKKHKHSVRAEVCTLFVHGLLHCAGYGHSNIREEKKMKTAEKKIIRRIQKNMQLIIHYD